MPRPHGGKLINKLTRAALIDKRIEEAKELPKVDVSTELRIDLENIAVGLYSPLKGPLTKNDFDAVVDKGRLSNDVPWTIPILLDVSEKDSEKFKEGDSITISSNSENFAIIKVEEKYGWDKETYC